MKTITGMFENKGQVINAADDLISSGIDAEKVFADEEHNLVKVMIHDAIEREVTEILTRHKPTRLN